MFLKNQKLAFPVSMFILILFFGVTFSAFQNCARNENKNDDSANRASGPEITNTTDTALPKGDKAVFKLSEKYGGEAVSNIFMANIQQSMW